MRAERRRGDSGCGCGEEDRCLAANPAVKAAARRGRGGRRARKRERARAAAGKSTRRSCVVGWSGRGKGKGVSGAAARSAQPLYDDADADGE